MCGKSYTLWFKMQNSTKQKYYVMSTGTVFSFLAERLRREKPYFF